MISVALRATRLFLLTALWGSIAGGGRFAGQASAQAATETSTAATSVRVSVAEIDQATRSHLERAEAALAEGQYSEAVDALRRVMDASGEALIAVDPAGLDARHGFVRYVPIRRYCHLRLAALCRTQPEALRAYRQEVDSLAQQWWDQAESEGDPGRLQRIVDECFLSSLGDQALLRLGSLALEQGAYRRARDYWEQISPVLRFPATGDPALEAAEGRSLWWLLRGIDLDANWDRLAPLLTADSGRHTWLAYPDTDVPLGTVRARLALVSILAGESQRASLELELLRRLCPNAAGQMGGRSGDYSVLLDELRQQSRRWPNPATDSGWPTFGGSPSRNGASAAPLDVAGAPLWEVELPRLRLPADSAAAQPLRVGEPSDGQLSYYPIVDGDLVVVSTGPGDEDFEGIDLFTGEIRFPRGNAPVARTDFDRAWPLATGVPRFTLTARDGRIYARVGSPITGSRGDPVRSEDSPGRLLAVDPRAQRRRNLEIRLTGPEWIGAWAVEGSPLADGNCLYAGLRRRDSVRAETHVACFDAQQGRLVWRRFVCAGETVGPQRPYEITHNLLTLDQGTLYYNTNLGAVAALRAGSGEIQWLATYPRAAVREEDDYQDSRHLARDLNPCLVARDMVFVAPADCDRIFALDAVTGHPLWITMPGVAADALHVLGVAEERLLVSGDCLSWLDVYTGKLVGQFPRSRFPAPGHARPAPRGCGRGLLAGPYVYWPTQDALFVFEQRTVRGEGGWEPVLVREIPLRPRGARGGNLALAGGVLLIAAADRLYAFDETGNPRDARGERPASRPEAERSVSSDHD